MKYYYREVESGELVEVSKEFWEARNHFMQKMLSMVAPKVNGKVIGKIEIASTNIEDGDTDFKKLWETPEK